MKKLILFSILALLYNICYAKDNSYLKLLDLGVNTPSSEASVIKQHRGLVYFVMETVYCRKCEESKLISEFSKNDLRSSGVSIYCKSCVSKAYRDKKTYNIPVVEDLPGEVWRAVRGYEGHYGVSNKGRVKSIPRTVLHTSKGVKTYRVEPGGVLKLTCTNHFGYYHVSLKKDGVVKSYTVHRLVAISFIDRIEGSDIVNHIDSNPKNNNAENLEWTTMSGNTQHALLKGRMKSGAEHHNSKVVMRYSKSGQYIDEFASASIASDFVGVSVDAISKCCAGVSKSSAGFKWKYKNG